MAETEIGHISDFFVKVSVAGIDITSGQLKVGDTIHILGHTTDINQKVESIQIEHQQVEAAKPGDSIGVRIEGRCRRGDKVFLVTE